MSEFTEHDLRRLIRISVGVDDSVDLDSDILDVPFTELGYDSLAVLEVAGRIEKEFPVSIPDDDVADLETPRKTIDYVNSKLASTA
ncbi:acyl carrier protein [Amycolatopsis aidingensis]|uniref:acyl carrier protein n=1 Tax=Amycolatopsis aidingensis TaxID=2842453 RepID=UPI001C0AB199|nr:acyl carrier protein [Amycolatopsis aidingensis]